MKAKVRRPVVFACYRYYMKLYHPNNKNKFYIYMYIYIDR